MKKTHIVVCVIILHATYSHATKWSETEVVDPISGEIIKVQSIASYGSYVYQWPSKYDVVYWPFTTENYIWFNPGSGYIAFGVDFATLKDEAEARVSAFIKKNYDHQNPPTTHIDKLKWLAQLSKVRGVNEEFYIRHYCLLSYLTRYDEENSLKYREEALERIIPYLEKAQPSSYRVQLHLVAGFYSALLGTGNEDKYWNSVTELDLGIDDQEKEKQTREYLTATLHELKSGKYRADYYRKPEDDMLASYMNFSLLAMEFLLESNEESVEGWLSIQLSVYYDQLCKKDETELSKGDIRMIKRIEELANESAKLKKEIKN